VNTSVTSNDMPVYVIDPPAQAHLSISGTSDCFPVHRVYCVGRNYAAHAVEMGHDPDKEAPFFFQNEKNGKALGNRQSV